MRAASSAKNTHPQVVLSKDEALEIFSQKYAVDHHKSQTARSAVLASAYGISAKTVRDIWCGRSWLEATYDLWEMVKNADTPIMQRKLGIPFSTPMCLF